MNLVETIEEDLKQRISASKGLPDVCTLGAIAQLYQVSTTPVRLVVGALIEQGYILKHGNGRLEINSERLGKKRKETKKINAVSDPNELDDRLLNDIIILSLKGEAKYLREEAYAKRNGVGRTTIRGLFNRFAGRNLLEHVPRCGWQIPPYSHEDMRAFLAVREIMELKALRLARKRLKRDQLLLLLEANSSVKAAKPLMDDSLHDYFIGCSGNSYIQDFFKNKGSYWEALFNYAAPATSQVAEMAADHCIIVKALMVEKWAVAEKALSQHIKNQGVITSRLVDQMSRDL